MTTPTVMLPCVDSPNCGCTMCNLPNEIPPRCNIRGCDIADCTIEHSRGIYSKPSTGCYGIGTTQPIGSSPDPDPYLLPFDEAVAANIAGTYPCGSCGVPIRLATPWMLTLSRYYLLAAFAISPLLWILFGAAPAILAGLYFIVLSRYARSLYVENPDVGCHYKDHYKFPNSGALCNNCLETFSSESLCAKPTGWLKQHEGKPTCVTCIFKILSQKDYRPDQLILDPKGDMEELACILLNMYPKVYYGAFNNDIISAHEFDLIYIRSLYRGLASRYQEQMNLHQRVGLILLYLKSGFPISRAIYLATVGLSMFISNRNKLDCKLGTLGEKISSLCEGNGSQFKCHRCLDMQFTIQTEAPSPRLGIQLSTVVCTCSPIFQLAYSALLLAKTHSAELYTNTKKYYLEPTFARVSGLKLQLQRHIPEKFYHQNGTEMRQIASTVDISDTRNASNERVRRTGVVTKIVEAPIYEEKEIRYLRTGAKYITRDLIPIIVRYSIIDMQPFVENHI